MAASLMMMVGPEMLGIVHDMTISNRRWKTNRDRIEIPAANRLFYLPGPLSRRHSRPGIEFPPFPWRDHQLHVSAADIDNKNFSLLHF
jgi:hypothetical protein